MQVPALGLPRTLLLVQMIMMVWRCPMLQTVTCSLAMSELAKGENHAKTAGLPQYMLRLG